MTSPIISKPPVLGTKTVKIKIVGSSSVLKEVKCHLFYDKPFYKIRKEYTTRMEVFYKLVKFTFNGEEILKYCTPRSLNTKRGDVIEASLNCLKVKHSEGIKEKNSNNEQPILEGMIEAQNLSPDINETEDNILDRSNVKPPVLGKSSILIKIIGSSVFEEVICQVRNSKPMVKIFEEYTSLIGCDFESAEFTFNGKIVNYDKPTKLGLQNGDVIHFKQTSLVTIKIGGSHEILKEEKYSVTLNSSLAEITRKYASFVGRKYNRLKFAFNNIQVDDNNTPASLRLENGDVIQVIKVPNSKIKLKFVNNFYNNVSLSMPVETPLWDIAKQYKSSVKEKMTQLLMVYNGRLLKNDETLSELNITNGEVIHVYTEKDEIDIKLIGTDGNKVSLHISLVVFIKNIRHEYGNCVESSNETILIYNGSVISDYDTPLSLNMKENDAIQVYREDDKINFKISLQTTIPKDSNYSVKYGDSLSPVMIGFTDKMGIDLNSVRFMIGDRRIKFGQTLKEAKIPPNAVILVYNEYKTISLKVVFENTQEMNFRTKIDVSFEGLKKEIANSIGKSVSCLRFLFDGNRILDDQSPESLEMEENDVIEVNINYINIS